MFPAATAVSSARHLIRPPVAGGGGRIGAPRPPLRFTTPLVVARRAKPARPRFCARSETDSGVGVGQWEDPTADGYGSEYDEEEDGDEAAATAGVWGGHEAELRTALAVDSEYEELVKEVELLLSPEEKAILQQNKVPNLSKISTMKWSPFHSLALSMQIPVMDKLLEYGTDIDTVDKDGSTALHKAVMGKKEAVISHLLRKGANPHVKDRDGATPLHYAVQVGAMQTVKLLIKYKVDVNVADNEGWTPLHIAIQSRCRDIAKVLLVNGADKTIRNKDGKLPLDLSLCYGRDFKSYELAKLLKLVPANRNY